MAHLLVVDDEPAICWGLTRMARQMGHEMATVPNAEQGLAFARSERPAAIFLDVRLPGMDGLTAIEHFRNAIGDVPIIIMTAHGDLGTAVEAVRNNAFEYLTKPFDLDVAERVLHRALQDRPKPTGNAASQEPPAVDGLVGKASAMQDVFKTVAMVAHSEACVHLCGESGTGKELIARAIHRYSQRAAGPFVAVNLAALSPGVVESELFGHVRGAFTGAEIARDGLMVQANGGTIFLDEVADIPLSLQLKLLRVLEYGEVFPVGASQPVITDLRVVSATHQNLLDKVADGTFRHDLFFRLSTFRIEIPPLRDRRGDIAVLAEHFLSVLAEKNHQPRPTLTAAALHDLEQRPWWGNVRELRNALEHALVLARNGMIEPAHLPAPVLTGGHESAMASDTIGALLRAWTDARLNDPNGSDLIHEQLLALVEPPVLAAALARSQGQVATAARRLGLHRITLRKKLDQYGITAK